MRLLALETRFEWMTVLSAEKRKSGGGIEMLGVTRPGGGMEPGLPRLSSMRV